jgi:hypothetical protein
MLFHILSTNPSEISIRISVLARPDKNISAKSDVWPIRYRQLALLNQSKHTGEPTEATGNVLKPFYGPAETVKLDTSPLFMYQHARKRPRLQAPLCPPLFYIPARLAPEVYPSIWWGGRPGRG